MRTVVWGMKYILDFGHSLQIYQCISVRIKAFSLMTKVFSGRGETVREEH